MAYVLAVPAGTLQRDSGAWVSLTNHPQALVQGPFEPAMPLSLAFT
jgi:hypothetical protein